MAIFGDFLRPAFSASRVQHVSDLHPKFALKPHHVWKYGRLYASDLQPLRLGERKERRKKERKKKPHGKNIVVCPIP